MSCAEETVAHENQNLSQRSLYDRRAGNDRRSTTALGHDGLERRQRPERRLNLREKRLGWVRDTKWSSINLELLR